MACLLMLVACGRASRDEASAQAVAASVVTRAGNLIVRDAWSRPTGAAGAGEHANHGGAGAANGIIGVVYLTIENAGQTPERWVLASSTRSPNVTLHQTVLRDGMFEMVPLPQGLVISPTTTVELKPAGLHLMVSDVQTPLLANESYSLTLCFESGLEMTVLVYVRPV